MISIVIPCFRSEKTIEFVVNHLLEVLNQREEKSEIILVNDGSPDDVWLEIIKIVNKTEGKVFGINFSRNFGQHSAILAGYRFAKGDIVVTMDDDGQTNSEYLWKLVDKLRTGYDIVFAEYPEKKESLYRRMGSALNFKMCSSFLGMPRGTKPNSFHAIQKYIIDEMVRYDNPYPYIAGLMFRSTNNIGSVIVPHEDRIEGTSGYSIGKLIGLTINGFTAFSIKPLRFASYLGVICALLGFLYGISVIVKKLMTPTIQLGYSSLMSTLLFVGGMLMLMLGIIGEYIGRMYISINNAPQYVIKETTKKSDSTRIPSFPLEDC